MRGGEKKDLTWAHIVVPLDAKKRRGVAMHPMDILEIYRSTQLKQAGDPVDEKEKQRRELVLWQNIQEQRKDTDEKRKERQQTIRIRHDLLEAVKREKELQFKQKLKAPMPVIKEEKPLEPAKVAQPIAVAYRRKKKREAIW